MQLVSIVMPFFDPQLTFFREAIESVLAQTYENWELLLVDDGSGASASEFALRMAEQQPRKIRYFEHDNHRNLGVSATRNLGHRHARGDYIAILDSDDVWLEHKLERQLAVLAANPQAVVLFGNTIYWHSWTGLPKDASRDRCPRLGVDAPTSVPPPRYLELALQGRAAVPCPASLIFERRLLETVGGFEDSFRGLYEDQVFFAKLWLNCNIYVIPDCLVKYRQHSGSMCAQASHAQSVREARKVYLNWLQSYLREQGYEGTKVWRRLEVERWICAMGWTGAKLSRVRRLFWRIAT